VTLDLSKQQTKNKLINYVKKYLQKCLYH